MPKVSVIIPIYNVENYLEECLNSVVNQTLNDIEIICVNDGSTDKSLAILEKYAATDKRIKIINKENGGYGQAMNTGINNVTGEYIGIVEPDDYVELDMYEKLYNKAVETKSDFVKANYYKFSEDLEQIEIKLGWTNEYYNRVLKVKNKNLVFNNIHMNTWAGIYKTEFIRNNNIRYNETPGARYQDQGFWFQTCIYADTVYFIDLPFYHYRYFKNNSTNNTNGYEWICAEYEYIYNLIKNDSEKRKQYIQVYNKFKFYNYLFNYTKLDNKSKKRKLKQFREIFLKAYETGEVDLSDFGWYERYNFELLIKRPDKFYRHMTNSLNLLQKMFSLRNQGNHKIIRLFGLKLKIRRNFSEENNKNSVLN